jgi:hypothetical protein
MWKQHLAAKSITDTSEPFTDSIAIAAAVVNPTFANVVLQSNMEGTDGVQVGHADDTHAVAWTSSSVTVVYDDAQAKFGSTSKFMPVSSTQWSGIAADGLGAEDINTQAFSIEVFVRFSSVAADATFASMWGASARQWLWEWDQSAGNMVFSVSVNGSAIVGVVSASWSPVVDTWYHVAVCRDSSDNLRMYVDGTQIGSTAASYTHDIFYSATRSFLLGYGNNNIQFQGHMDAPRFVIGEGIYNSDSYTVPTEYYPTS